MGLSRHGLALGEYLAGIWRLERMTPAQREKLMPPDDYESLRQRSA